MGVTPAGKMGSWSCAMVLPASLAPAFPPRNCPFLVQSIFLASHKLPPHFRMSEFELCCRRPCALLPGCSACDSLVLWIHSSAGMDHPLDSKVHPDGGVHSA